MKNLKENIINLGIITWFVIPIIVGALIIGLFYYFSESKIIDQQNISLSLKNIELQDEVKRQAILIQKFKSNFLDKQKVIDSLKLIKNKINIQYLPRYEELQALPLQGQITELNENLKFCDTSTVTAVVYANDTLLSVDWWALYCINSTFLDVVKCGEELAVADVIIEELEGNQNNLFSIIALQDSVISNKDSIISNKDIIIDNQQKVLKKTKNKNQKTTILTTVGLGLLGLILILN